MYSVTDLNGVTTLVSFKSIILYAIEVIGLKMETSKTPLYSILTELEEQGYKVDYATDQHGNYIYY